MDGFFDADYWGGGYRLRWLRIPNEKQCIPSSCENAWYSGRYTHSGSFVPCRHLWRLSFLALGAINLFFQFQQHFQLQIIYRRFEKMARRSPCLRNIRFQHLANNNVLFPQVVSQLSLLSNTHVSMMRCIALHVAYFLQSLVMLSPLLLLKVSATGKSLAICLVSIQNAIRMWSQCPTGMLGRNPRSRDRYCSRLTDTLTNRLLKTGMLFRLLQE